MSGVETAALLVVLVALAGWFLSYTAARLHRLHTRVEGTLAALDAQLVRRAEAALELAGSGRLDPAASFVVADAAGTCLDVSTDGLGARDWEEASLAARESAEDDLTAALRLVVGELDGSTDPAESGAGRLGAAERSKSEGPGGPGPPGAPGDMDVLARVLDAHDRVRLARAFYNDAVRDVRWLRGRAVVRACRLAGRAELPRRSMLDAAPLASNA